PPRPARSPCFRVAVSALRVSPLGPGRRIYALNRVMTELEQQQFDAFCKQMQASGE
uniref:Small vasohibin-binding protein n=1 Tax=Crocodylus porosus TaxID=8502 RepID=A0A7M4FCC8_CROPO